VSFFDGPEASLPIVSAFWRANGLSPQVDPGSFRWRPSVGIADGGADPPAEVVTVWTR